MNNTEIYIEKIFEEVAKTNTTLQQRLYVTWHRYNELNTKNLNLLEVKAIIEKNNMHQKYKTYDQINSMNHLSKN